MTTRFVLAIETAIGGGSLAVLSGDEILATLAGVSRAESLIVGVESVLSTAALTLSEISTIAVSRGPGSFTGIRIGIATAIGLGRSSGSRCVGISIFDAVAGSISSGSVSVVVSLGRGQFGVQVFDCGASKTRPRSDPVSISESDIAAVLDKQSSDRILFCDSKGAGGFGSQFPNLEVVDQDLAVLIARHAFRSGGKVTLEPLYLGK